MNGSTGTTITNSVSNPIQESKLMQSILDEFFTSFYEKSEYSSSSPASLLESIPKFLDYISLIFKGELFSYFDPSIKSKEEMSLENYEPIKIFKKIILMPLNRILHGHPLLISKIFITAQEILQNISLYHGVNSVSAFIDILLDIQLNSKNTI